MRNLVVAFILGSSLAMSFFTGEEALRNGDRAWPLWLIVFPLVSLGGLVALLLEHRKKTKRRCDGDEGQSALR
ncbi:hypothetical protein [Brevibacterium metallidurans]|uniref:Uncharacterized protein n=1 Tax=Brevibacterium metallidurans TaxID=1482676 RepID=A0ABN0SRG6_9MICO